MIQKALLKISIVLFLLLAMACSEDINEPINSEILSQMPNLPETPFEYANQSFPEHITSFTSYEHDNTPIDNAITNAGATLGRVLFYDKNLSANNSISCGSCHLQVNGFSDPEKFSKGFEGKITSRNSMSLINARYYQRGSFFWDERAQTLEQQVLMPIQDKIEMGMTLPNLIRKLERIDYYPQLFADAFGDTKIDTIRIAKALAQFIRSIVSYNSKFDNGVSQTGSIVSDDFPNFTEEENLGAKLFIDPLKGNCGACHFTGNFIINRPMNNGLDEVYTDDGFGKVTGFPRDKARFKVPSLKSIEFTSPYMHDGRFTTLEEVVEHYNSGIKDHPNLEGFLKQNDKPVNFNLNKQEVAALVAFMKTFSDYKLRWDEKFSDPFSQ